MSKIGCKFRARAKLAEHLEEELNWLSVWRKSQISFQIGVQANFH